MTVIVLLAAGTTWAGDKSAADKISLEQALRDFYQGNYDVLISRYEIDKAYADYIGARLLPNPSVSFNYTFSGLRSFPRANDNTQTVTRVEQLIELGGKRQLRTSAALEGLDASRFSQKDTVRTLLIGFYTLFFSINADILNVELARSELTRFDRTMEIANMRFQAGFLSLVDYTKLKLARIDLENNLINLQSQMNNDVEQFSLLLGSVAPLTPAIEVREDFTEYTEEDLLKNACQYRFDLLSIEKQLKASDINQRIAKAQAVPDITVGAELDTLGPRLNPGVGLGFSIPLPLFNRNQGEIARRQAEYNQLQVQRDKVKRLIVSDIRQAVNNYWTAKRIFDTYKGRKTDMEDLMSRSEKAFSLGGITILDLLDTERTYRDFMTKYNQAIVQGNLSRELLKVYTGEIK
ncbi:MAG: TolC family protein [Nitrospirae bacterium]|nr:TolC family protein [Nitrospirota bacterium]MBF0592000.1 TolC family protein [Nitrospirota bacterium]